MKPALRFFLAISILAVFFAGILRTSYAQGPKLYGLTSQGGANELGAIIHYDPATGVQVTDYSFRYSAPGASPFYGELSDGGNGKFYGMTSGGGANHVGVIFEWDPATNIYIKKIDLDNTIGCSPYGSLTLSGGKFYGMTNEGGTNGAGVIFEWDPVTNIYIKKIDLSSTTGSYPYGTLTLSGGKFYGMTGGGGSNGYGAIFEWDPATNTYTKKVDLNVTNGYAPLGSLFLNGGKFYGMTMAGGSNSAGAIFEWNPSTNIYAKKIDLTSATGKFPTGSLSLSGGKFYGMTQAGGAWDEGVIFEWDPTTNTYTKKIDLNSTSGYSPWGSLSLNGGKFYGMTNRGGTNGAGVIFEWDPVSNTYTKKIDMSSATGSFPYGSLLLSAGKFYGMTYQGGSNDLGVIFEWNPATNTYTKKIDLSSTTGSYPYGSLSLSGGKLYGMTHDGGLNGTGVIFEWDPASNTYTKKIDLSSTTGSNPYGSLSLSGGKFYGMTNGGGTNGAGVIFEWDPATNIYTKKIDLSSATGSFPHGSLVLSGGKFYGMTHDGGSNDLGVIFEWDPVTNAYTKKIDLDGITGCNPNGFLSLNGGKFYGMTTSGGSNGYGVIFEWDPASNTYTKKIDLYSARGTSPFGSLSLSGGKFYGMTRSGGSNDIGVIFEWDPATNTYTKKFDLTTATGSFPYYTQFVEYATCINPTSGGAIAADQSGCNPFDPALLTSSSAPTSYTGTLEYKWQKSTTGSSAGFTDIAGSNAATYDPPAGLMVTTWYKRLVRVSCTADWSGAQESNVVQVTVYPVSIGGTIAGSTTVCSGTNTTTLTLSGHTGSIVKWQYSTNNWVSSTDVANTTTTLIATNLTTTTKYRAVIQSGVCPSANSGDATIIVVPIPVPTINGSSSLCVNSGYYNYTTEPGMNAYVWTVSAGGSITYGSGTNQIVITWNTAGVQMVSVIYTSPAGCSPVGPTVKDVTVNPPPGNAGSITGTTTICAGTQGVPYATPAIANAMTYVWTLPPGATIQNGAGTNSIMVDFAMNALSGDIFVCGNNLCGNGTTSPSFPVIVHPIPETPVVVAMGATLSSSAPLGNQWYYSPTAGGTGTPVTGATSQVFAATQTGWYWTIVTLNDCSSEPSIHEYVLMTGMEEIQESAFGVYPVPNNGLFTVTVQYPVETTFSIIVYNTLGSKILEYNDLRTIQHKYQRTIDLQPIPDGIYSIEFFSTEFKVIRKVLVRR